MKNPHIKLSHIELQMMHLKKLKWLVQQIFELQSGHIAVGKKSYLIVPDEETDVNLTLESDGLCKIFLQPSLKTNWIFQTFDKTNFLAKLPMHRVYKRKIFENRIIENVKTGIFFTF